MSLEQHNRKIRNKLSNFLKGKRVCIVGPAPSIIGSNQGEIIDNYDVVVRLNKALPIPEDLSQDIGTRTDILYNCMNPSEECGGKISISTLNRSNCQFLVGAYPPLERMGSTKIRTRKDNLTFYQKYNSTYSNFCYTDLNYFRKLWKNMKMPNTGVMTILDLLRFDIKELYITGITFFKGGYYSKYRKYNEKQVLKRMEKFNLHKQNEQRKYVTKVLSKDPRVRVDQALYKIICDETKKTTSIKCKILQVNQQPPESVLSTTVQTKTREETTANEEDTSKNQVINKTIANDFTKHAINIYKRSNKILVAN